MATKSAAPPSSPPEGGAVDSSDPMELLDRIIDELEKARAEAIQLSRNVGPLEQATLAAALNQLEARLAEAKEKRDDVRLRVARTSRIRELASEMATLRDEAAAASRGEIDEARAAEVRARIEEIRVEAEGMKSGRG